MFDFDDLFSRRDPYGSFATLLVDLPTGKVTSTARGLLSLESKEYASVLEGLLESRPGLDIRPLVHFAAESEGILANLHEVHAMVAAQIAVAVQAMRTDEEFEEWLRAKAAEGVRAVVEEDSQHAAKNAEVPYPLPDHFACLHEVLEIPFENLRRAAAAVNDLPRMQRIAFVRLFLQARPPESVVSELNAPIMEVLENAKSGIAALHAQRIDRYPGEDE